MISEYLDILDDAVEKLDLLAQIGRKVQRCGEQGENITEQVKAIRVLAAALAKSLDGGE